MANKIANRVKMTIASVASSGTGDITLGSSVPGYLTFAEGGVSNADTVPYVLEAANGDWEIGRGTYTSSGTVLARTTVTKSSVGGVIGTSKITASSTTIVMISPLAADLQAGTAAGNLVQLDSTASIPVSNGGTGLTSLTAGYIPYGNGTGAFSVSNIWTNGTNVGFGTSTVPAIFGTTVRAFNSGNGATLVTAGATVINQLWASEGLGLAGLGTASPHALAIFTNEAERLRIASDGSVTWGNSGSGYLMSLTSGGNLGLGTTSPSTYANSYGPVLVVGTGNNFATIQGRTDGPSGASNGVAFGGSYSNNPINGSRIWFGAQGSGGQQGMIGFFVKNVNDNTTQPTQAMTLDASGNLGVGVTSPGNYGKFVAKTGTNANFSITANGTGNLNDAYNAWQSTQINGNPLIFGYGNYASEAMRIDASGNLLVGTTSTSNTVVGWKFLPAVNGSGFVCDTTGDGPSISFTNINSTIANGYRWFSFRINSGGTQAGSISYNTGTSQVNYNQTSDRRIKSNITPALPVLDKMKQVEVVSFDMGQGHTDYGVIAQDLHKLFPEAVSVGDDLDEPKTLWGFAGASLVPAMVKAIQELAAKVSALEARQ